MGETMLNDIQRILERIEAYPKQRQEEALRDIKIILDSLDIQIENDEKICQTEGHIYEKENEGWVDNSYLLDSKGRKNHVSVLTIYNSSISMIRRATIDEGVQICFNRKCIRCGAVETKDRIPLALLKKREN